MGKFLKKTERTSAKPTGHARGGKLRRALKRFSMPRKWLLLYVILIVLPASVILYWYYQRTTAVVEEEATRSMQQTLHQAGLNLAYRLERVQDISNSAFMNPKLYEYLSAKNDEDSIGKQLEVFKELQYLVETVQTNADVFRVRLFVDKTKLYAGEKVNFFALDALKSRPWYNRVIEADGAMVWTGVYRESFIDKGDTWILSCARMLRDPQHFDEAVGVMTIDVQAQKLEDVLSGLELTSPDRIYMTDGEGTIVYHRDASRIGTKAPGPVRAAASGGSDGKAKLMTGSDTEYVLFTSVLPAGWKLVAEVPAVNISKSAQKQNQYSAIVALLGIFSLFLVLIFVLLAYIVRGMNRRVQQVIGVIRREGIERLEEIPPVAEGDFNMLERSVDQLIVRIRALVEQAFEARVQEREAQLRALQAQINPHFLYNTLDTINWIAIGRGATDISQMIDALAKYFRLSLNKGQDNVSVRDELMLAQVYLDIQQTRFPGSFEYRIEADAEAEPFLMPKLTLQPIVENALLHGIRKTKEKRGAIRIAAVRDGDAVVITVSDDGIGMEAERALRLLIEPQAGARLDGAGSSYGLYNVNERIRLYCGEAFGLAIESRPGAGTTVTVRLRARLADAE